MANDATTQRRESSVDMGSFLDEKAESSGQDIPVGQYPARFVKFGQPFVLDGKFGESTVVDLHFAITLKDGTIGVVSQLVNMPPAADKINVRSNMFKTLRSIKPSLIDDKKKFKKDVKVSQFCDSECQVTVAMNDKDWPYIEAVSQALEGMKCPKSKESKEAVEGSQDIPF